MIIKNVLKEELGNSIRIKREYQKNLLKLPKGCLVKKVIKGHSYYYLESRKGGKIIFAYLGKIAPSEIKRYREAKVLKEKYKRQVFKLNEQIRFIKRSLRG